MRKILTILLAICLLITYAPQVALANETDPASDNSVSEDILDTPAEPEDNGETELAMQRLEELSDAGVDFSTKRLIVKGSKKDLKDEPVIANIDNIYLLQYEEYMDAIDAYYRLSESSDSVEFDSPITIASPGIGIAAYGGEEIEPMTEKENPFTEAESVKTDKKKYDIAVIDTGANEADKIVSVLGDNGKDKNGHGQKMIDTIKSYASDSAVLSIKAIGDDGVGDVSAVYAAIKLAIDEKVGIINLSISALATADNFIIEEIIKEAQSQGIIVVGAAGNNGMDAKLTIPGKIEEAIIAGTTNEASNTGDTVDYYLPVESTSLAAATITGILISDSLKDYTIKDKVVDLKTEETGEDSSPTTPTDNFTTQEHSDSAGGSGGDGAGPTNGGKWTNSTTGRIYVWYDRGGFVGDGIYPTQGYYARDGKWYDNTGSNPKTTQQSKDSNNWNHANSFYTYKFFIGQLTAKIQKRYNKAYSYDFMKRGWVAGKNDTALKDYMKEACQKALNRNPKAETARVIGVAVTYRVGTFSYNSSKWTNVWAVMPSKGDKSYKGMFGGNSTDNYPSAAPDVATNPKAELIAPNWTLPVSPSHSSQYAGRPWNEYAYLTGKSDNSSFSADTNTKLSRLYVIAVADNEPPNTVEVKINKTFGNSAVVAGNPLYSLAGITFNLYGSQADAKANNNPVATFVTDANGNTEKQEVAPGDYFLVEMGPPEAGVIIPRELEAKNGGYPVTASQGLVIDISDTPLTGTYTANYTYESNDGSTLPIEVMATLPAISTHQNGSTVTAPTPSPAEITIGNINYTFVRWDVPKKSINSANVIFTGTWRVEDLTPDDDWADEEADDSMAINYTYVLDGGEEGEELPDEVWSTLPNDLDEDGLPNVYDEGDTVTPETPDETTVTVGDITYTFVGWDKNSDTFTDNNVLFTGTWRKQTN